MIIFDLDGTLACPEHRRHFVDPVKAGCIQWINTETGKTRYGSSYIDGIFQEWKPNWEAFYEACDQDAPIKPVIEILNGVFQNTINFWKYVQIWSGRCESVREKTLDWLEKNILFDGLGSKITLKMRPIGDNTPDDELKMRWLDEAISEGKHIDFVFDDRPKMIRAWRERGIFVFNCAQGDEEF